MSTVRIGYAGLTHLGLCSAVGAAIRGHSVVAFDADEGLTARLSAGEPHVSEPELIEAMREHAGRLAFTSDISTLAACDVVYVAPDVPTDDSGRSDTSSVEATLAEVLDACPQSVTVVVLSQVSPGFTRAHARGYPNLYYQVETLIFGRAIERATLPERFMVGSANPAKPLPDGLRTFLESFECPVLVMRYESAELAKIAINCMLVSTVAASNTLAEICESIGADWSEIAPALRLDRRIGPYAYLAPGLGISGGNLERDLASVRRMSKAHDTDDGVVAAWQDNSRHRKAWPGTVLLRELGQRITDAKVAVLGLAYKEDTHSTKNSPALVLVSTLIERGATVIAYDPVVREIDEPRLSVVECADAAIAGVDAVAIMTPWPEFRDVSASDLAEAMAGRLVVDPYGMIDDAAARAAGLDHFRLGTPPVRAGRG